MKLKDYVFILGSYKCDKNCPYCIAKMNKRNTEPFKEEITKLKKTLANHAKENTLFTDFILSGNGEPSMYSIKELEEIKNIVESSNIFSNYRIQTSGNLFYEKSKLKLFSNWIKEITVISSNPKEDKNFYKYNLPYLESEEFLKTKHIRVNIVVTNNNLLKINDYINYYSLLDNVDTIALKILDNTQNNSKESKWIEENALTYDKIDTLIEKVKEDNKFITFRNKRFIFETKTKKILTIHYSEKNTYDEINLKSEFSWHKKVIKKGVYGEFSKVEEELEEAKDALEQKNKLMFLIELSDIIGAIEGIAEKHGLTLDELITFSNKVKESKLYE